MTISGAEFSESVQIFDGKAYLGVSVCTNGDVTVSPLSYPVIN